VARRLCSLQMSPRGCAPTTIKENLKMIFEAASEQRVRQSRGDFRAACLALALIVIVFARPLCAYVRESLMQRVTSGALPNSLSPGALSQEAMTAIRDATGMLFVAVVRSQRCCIESEIRVIFDP